MKKLIYIIIALSIALAACEKTLDFPFEYKQPKLVLNCTLSPTEPIKFTMSRSMHALDSKDIVFISDADVVIFEDDKPLQVVPFSSPSGFYWTTYIPKAGHTYKFQISKEGFETIEAEAKIAEPTTINGLSGKIKGEDGIYNGYFDVNLNFNDNPDEENYYFIYTTTEFPPEMEEYNSDYKLDLECNDLSVNRSYDRELLYLADEIISNGNYTLKFQANDYYTDVYGSYYEIEYYNYNGNEGENITENPEIEDLPFYREFEYRLIVHVASINKDYYQYLKSFDLYNENEGNPFAEPTLVKTNVKNGLGILGSISEVTDTLKFVIKNPYLEEEK